MAYQRLKDELPPEASKFINKEWLSILSNTTRETHADADGQLADEDGMFTVGGYTVPWPGHYDLPPEERCQCRCSTSTAFGAGAPEDEIEQILAEGELTGDSIDDLVPDELTPIGVDAPPEDAAPQVQPWNGTADDILRFIAEDPEIERVAAKFIEEHAETLVDMEKRQSVTDSKLAEIASLRSEYEKMNAAMRKESDPDKLEAMRIERNAFAERIGPIAQSVRESNAELEGIIAESRKSLYEPIENRAGMVMRVRTKDDGIKQKASDASEFISAVMVKKAKTPEFDLKLTSKKRAFYKYSEKSVNVSKYDSVSTHVHEMAHHIEYTSGGNGVADAANAFIDARVKAAGTKDVSLSKKFPSWGFDRWEIGNEDSFKNVYQNYENDASAFAHYTGKKYKRFGGKTEATELISMGVERLYRNPVTFAKQDPEYFKFILGVMKGKFVE